MSTSVCELRSIPVEVDRAQFPVDAVDGCHIAVSRWTLNEPALPISYRRPAFQGLHTLAIFLRDTQCTYFEGENCKFAGIVTTGMMHIISSGVASSMSFHRAADILYIYLRAALAREISSRISSNCDDDFCHALGPGGFFRDSALETLGRNILEHGKREGHFTQQYVGSIGRAMMARLLATGCERKDQPMHAKGLAPWRMNRVIEFIDCNLAERIGLADVSAVSGLSRMHFAAQFRLTTGLRPHEYLLRRRIQRAQQLLCESDNAVLEIAQRVGFRNSAHFATVFKRLVGETPKRWRGVQTTLPRARVTLPDSMGERPS
jgi:AraC family transcriptional regulator